MSDDGLSPAEAHLAAVEAEADKWAEEIELHKWLGFIPALGRLSPRATQSVRDRFTARAESVADALMRQCFIEGAYRAIDAICTAVENGTHPRFQMKPKAPPSP